MHQNITRIFLDPDVTCVKHLTEGEWIRMATPLASSFLSPFIDATTHGGQPVCERPDGKWG